MQSICLIYKRQYHKHISKGVHSLLLSHALKNQSSACIRGSRCFLPNSKQPKTVFFLFLLWTIHLEGTIQCMSLCELFPWVNFFKGHVTCISTSLFFIVKMFLLCGSSIFICQESPFQTCSPLGSADNRPSTRPGETITKIVVLWNYPLNSSISHDALLTQPLLGKSLLGEWRSLVGRMSWKWVMWPALLEKVDQRERRERAEWRNWSYPFFFKYKCVWIHFRAGGCCAY